MRRWDSQICDAMGLSDLSKCRTNTPRLEPQGPHLGIHVFMVS